MRSPEHGWSSDTELNWKMRLDLGAACERAYWPKSMRPMTFGTSNTTTLRDGGSMNDSRRIGTIRPLRSMIAGLLVLGTSLVAVAPRVVRAQPICDVEIWVSPDGSDDDAGSRARPLRTLEAARDAARADPRGDLCGVTIFIAGEHRLERTLVLEPVDSGAKGRPVVYRAWPGSRPTLSGAIRVQGWSLYDADHGFYRAQVGPVRSRRR